MSWEPDFTFAVEGEQRRLTLGLGLSRNRQLLTGLNLQSDYKWIQLGFHEVYLLYCFHRFFGRFRIWFNEETEARFDGIDFNLLRSDYDYLLDALDRAKRDPEFSPLTEVIIDYHTGGYAPCSDEASRVAGVLASFITDARYINLSRFVREKEQLMEELQQEDQLREALLDSVYLQG